MLEAFFLEQFGAVNHFGGDGTTTFAVPDLRGEFLRGTGTNIHTNSGSGSAVGVHQDATRHVRIEYGVSDKIFTPGKGAGRVYSNHDSEYNVDEVTGRSIIHSGSTDAYTLQKEYYTSRPTNTSVLYCIKYKSSVIAGSEGGSEDGDTTTEPTLTEEEISDIVNYVFFEEDSDTIESEV